MAQRYGWTLDYIMWEISYANLQLLMASIPEIDFEDDEPAPKGKSQGKKVDSIEDFLGLVKM